MSEKEREGREDEVLESGLPDPDPDMIRRDFVKRFGAYAAGTCAGLFVLMSPRTSMPQTQSDGGPMSPLRR